MATERADVLDDVAALAQMDKEQARAFQKRMTDSPPIGALPDGSLNVVGAKTPPFKPKIISGKPA